MAARRGKKKPDGKIRASSLLIDPRRGDVEDDASSTKRRSMLSLFGSLLVEISLPKLIIAWIMLLVIPGLLLGLAPIVFVEWLTIVTDKLASLAIGLWSLLILGSLIAIAWFGWRALFRMAEKNFWALNSIVVEPGYASFREAFRQLAERLLPRNASDTSRASLRAGAAAVAGIIMIVSLRDLYVVGPLMVLVLISNVGLTGAALALGEFRLALSALERAGVDVAAILVLGGAVFYWKQRGFHRRRPLT